jgi:hypothetical protein
VKYDLKILTIASLANLGHPLGVNEALGYGQHQTNLIK